MRLQTRLMLLLAAVLLLAFGAMAAFDYRREQADTLNKALAEARDIRALLMATRRVYHRQFLASGLPVTEQPLGFLPAHALSRISADFPHWSDSGVSFNNVSDRPRNPANAADEAELRAMDWFRGHPQSRERMVLVRPDDGTAPYYHFAQPIWIEQYCLQCHGRREDAPPTIRERYTQAFDYQVGDLRGVMSIKLPAGQLQDQLIEHWTSGLWLLGIALITAWGLLAWTLRRLVLSRLTRMREAVDRYAAGDYGLAPPAAGNDELGVVSRALGAMAGKVREREQALERSRRLYRTLSETNQLILRLERPETLYAEACRIAVEHGGFTLAWVGFESAGRLETAAAHGALGYLEESQFAADPDDPHGHGPSGQAYLQGRSRICNDFLGDPATAPWHEAAHRHRLAAAAALPLQVGNRTLGIFGLYSEQRGFFTPDVVELLEEMARDIAFAWDNYRRESDLVHSQERVRYLAHFDALTGLPNRALLRERLDQSLTRCRRHGHLGALLHLDLDRFKRVNDSLGHEAGDDLLRQVAVELAGALRREDTLARIGADEFLVLIEELNERRDMALNEARLVAEKLRGALSHDFGPAAAPLHMTLSAGIVLFPGKGEVDDLLRHADTAMHRAKAGGGDGIRFFDLAMETEARARVEQEQALQRALDEGELVPFYQPQVDGRSGALIGFEALLRWRHPVRGLVGPGEFIPVLEQSGLIQRAGGQVLRQVCGQLVQWRREGLWDDGMRLAVNLSPLQLQESDCVPRALRTIESQGAEPTWLELEVTEGMLGAEMQDVVSRLEDLRKFGVGIALDDFGTGYSSLHRLGRLPVDTMKIDRSFVADLPDDPRGEALVETIIAIGGRLGMRVLAEGVEDAGQRDFLLRHGCALQQGFLFGRPMPAEEATTLLRRADQPA